MITVHKAVIESHFVSMPKGAEILYFGNQNETPCLWFRCDTYQPIVAREIALCGTGHVAPSNSDGRYIGTAIFNGGSLVLHAFERINK